MDKFKSDFREAEFFLLFFLFLNTLVSAGYFVTDGNTTDSYYQSHGFYDSAKQLLKNWVVLFLDFNNRIINEAELFWYIEFIEKIFIHKLSSVAF